MISHYHLIYQSWWDDCEATVPGTGILHCATGYIIISRNL